MPQFPPTDRSIPPSLVPDGPPADLAPAAVRLATERWLERAVIGLNLCPFAKAEHVHGRILMW